MQDHPKAKTGLDILLWEAAYDNYFYNDVPY